MRRGYRCGVNGGSGRGGALVIEGPILPGDGIDGIVNGTGAVARTVGSILRLFQSGNIRSYAAWVTVGCVLLLIALAIGGTSFPRILSGGVR